MRSRLLVFALLAVFAALSLGARAASVDEQAADLLRRRAEVLFERGDFAAARVRLEHALDLHDAVATRVLLGRTRLALGDCRGALESFAPLRLDALAGRELAHVERVVLEARVACDALVVADTARAGMVRLAGGRFSMGSDHGEADERPVHAVSVSAYWLDRTEVTVADYERCVAAGGCGALHFKTMQDVRYCNFGNPQRLDHPMNCVDYSGAQAYCAWAGKRLPTEAEWEFAARGAEGRTYPWGEETPDCTRAIMENESNDGCGVDRTFAVGSRPSGASPEGVLDLAGNVWEWVADWYGAAYYASSGEADPTGPATGERRGMRGGSWLSRDPAGLRGANREHDDIDYVGNGVGFRCAAD